VGTIYERKVQRIQNLHHGYKEPAHVSRWRCVRGYNPNIFITLGVSKEPTFYRGESGANDSIVPLCDNILQLTSV
jgi:hypothetical protein